VIVAVEHPHATQWHILDQGMLAVHRHHFETGHATEFFVSVRVLEYVCPKCGEVLLEGPEFVDWNGGREWRFYAVRRRSRTWVRRFARKVARGSN
jgi:hypothetical protein